MQNPYQKYMQQSLSTMTQGQILVALYDKCVLELNKAVYYIEQKDIPKAHNSIIRVIDIVDTLDSNLKVKYEITETFVKLYQFFRENLVEANIKKDTEILKMLIPFFTELKDNFEEISRKGY